MFNSLFKKKQPEDSIKYRVFKCRSCGGKISAAVGHADPQPPPRCPICGSTKGLVPKRASKTNERTAVDAVIFSPQDEELILKSMEAAQRVKMKSAHILHILDLKEQGRTEELNAAVEEWEKMKMDGIEEI